MSSPPESPSDQVLIVSSDMKGARESHESLNVVGSGIQETEAQKLGPTSLASFRLYLILLVPSMASACVGYNISVMSYANGMEQYLSYFGLDGQDSGGGVGTTTALIFGMYTIGICLAVLFAGPVCDRFGRRGGMFAGGLFGIVGSILLTVARDTGYLKGGRFILGISTALLETAAPMYVVEMSPPQWRGRLAGTFAAIAILGSICGGIITIFTGRLNTSASWRVPFSVQIIPAAIVVFFAYLIPESPRWLTSVGRKDEALLILSRYHGNGNVNAPLVVLEYEEFEESTKCDVSSKPWWNFIDLFRTRSMRYRSFMVILMACCEQWSGSALSSFIVVLLANDHISTQTLRFILGLVSNIVAATGAFCGAVISDKVGRRTLWFWGNVCCTIALIISGACTAKWGAGGHNLDGSNTGIAFLFLFNFFFAATYLPLPAIYPSECMAFDNRANGVALYTFCASLAGLVGTYATPVALEKIQWRLYLVFIAWNAFSSILIWLFAVETAGRTLEELNVIFEDRHPVKASSRQPGLTITGRRPTLLNLVPVGRSKEAGA
ncbi:general substrate transporter [Mycena rosella]|uniref:General substrate transporter n=1 Tax=Mycena rosella TaxID=1033263 RepID=A0AAD7CYC5_MYCRO|nr:general substrate transporter [Mycena rosella]